MITNTGRIIVFLTLLIVGYFICYLLISYFSPIHYAKDSLRYFFSSTFQGFAAIFTLGSMFYIFYSERVYNAMNGITSKLESIISKNGLILNDEDSMSVTTYGIHYFIEQVLKKRDGFNKHPSYKSIDAASTFYFEIKYKHYRLKIKLTFFIIISTFILLFSLFSLLIIDLNDFYNDIASINAIYLLILSIIYLFILVSFIFNCFKTLGLTKFD